ncbi:ankyrin repeat domain-containing protein, partial [uncultured Meiothermus sp.]|uniref:ankyrin repeat domain-containing protein n=1 Tax=uncultured Meiothermus sp. TaxID=157471 RepID=UPI0026219D85
SAWRPQNDTSVILCVLRRQFPLLRWCQSRCKYPLLFSGTALANSLLSPGFWRTATPAILEQAIRAGAQVNARDNDDWTPFHDAAKHGENSDVLLKLLELGADPRAHTLAGETAWDLIQHNQRLTNTPAFWRLNDLRF